MHFTLLSHLTFYLSLINNKICDIGSTDLIMFHSCPFTRFSSHPVTKELQDKQVGIRVRTGAQVSSSPGLCRVRSRKQVDKGDDKFFSKQRSDSTRGSDSYLNSTLVAL